MESFGFTEIEALRDDDGLVWSAQLSTGDGVVLIGPEMAEFGTRSIADPAWATSRIFVYVDDVDTHFERSRACGATIVSEPAAETPKLALVKPRAAMDMTQGKDSSTRQSFINSADAPPCPDCGCIMIRNGTCYKCMNCGTTSGCS